MLTASPHRLFFFIGALQGVAAIVWWLADLAGRYGGWYAAPNWSVPAPWAHTYLFLYGLFPSFIFGFLMTAMPNWLGVDVRRPQFVAAGASLGLGLVFIYLGLATGIGLALAGLALHLAGWLIAALELVRLIRRTNSGNLGYPTLITTLVAIGGLCAATLPFALVSDASWAWEIGKRGAWFFLLPLFFAISHRMVPFFSSRVLADYTIWRPQWTLWVVIAGAYAHAALDIAGAWRWLWLIDAPLAGVVLVLVLRWGLARCFAARLLAVQHLSLVGLVVALFLSALQSAGWTMLGNGPMHAMTIGYFAAMAVGMVSRVSLGHSGHALIADRVTWIAFWGMLATAAARVAAEFVQSMPALWPPSILAAGALWLIFFGLWAARYMPVYLRPRADGRPG